MSPCLPFKLHFQSQHNSYATALLRLKETGEICRGSAWKNRQRRRLIIFQTDVFLGTSLRGGWRHSKKRGKNHNKKC